MDAYKIGIAILLNDGFSRVLSRFSHQLLGVHGSVKEIEKGIGRWSLAIGGVGAVIAGSAILGGMTKIVEKTKEYSDELVKLQRLGGGMETAVVSGELGRRAFDIAQRVPMRVTDLMKIPGATYSILGQEESMKLWEPLARFSWVMQSQTGYKGDPGADLQKLLRAGELSGRLTDPVTHQVSVAQTERFLDMAARTIAATHGMVNPDTLLGMAKQGGFTLRGLSDQGFYTQAIMAQAMGGPRAGTAFLSLWQQMAAGTMFTRTAEGMQELGLLKPGEWHKSAGRVVLGDEASRRLTAMIGKDPLEFAANVIAKMKEHGITDPEDQMRAVMRIMNRQTTQRYTAEQVTNFMQMVAERERLMGGFGADKSFNLLGDKAVTPNLQALSNAWDNLLTAIAGPNSENTIAVLKTLTDGINYLTSVVNSADPRTIRDIAGGIAILGAALMTAGIVALVAAIGVGGWIAAGLVALAGAAYELYRHWPAIVQFAADLVTNVVAKVSDAIKAITSAISEFASWLWQKAKGIVGIGPATGFGNTTNYVPPSASGGTVQVNSTVNLDGRKVGEAVTQHQVRSAAGPAEGSPYHDPTFSTAPLDFAIPY